MLLLLLNNELLSELQTKESLSWVLNKLTDLQVLCAIQTNRQSDDNLGLFNATFFNWVGYIVSHVRMIYHLENMWTETAVTYIKSICYNCSGCTEERHNKLNPLNAELIPICHLLALLGVHHFLHVSRIRVKSLTLRLLMSHIYGAPILDVSRSHTTTQHSR